MTSGKKDQYILEPLSLEKPMEWEPARQEAQAASDSQKIKAILESPVPKEEGAAHVRKKMKGNDGSAVSIVRRGRLGALAMRKEKEEGSAIPGATVVTAENLPFAGNRDKANMTTTTECGDQGNLNSFAMSELLAVSEEVLVQDKTSTSEGEEIIQEMGMSTPHNESGNSLAPATEWRTQEGMSSSDGMGLGDGDARGDGNLPSQRFTKSMSSSSSFFSSMSRHGDPVEEATAPDLAIANDNPQDANSNDVHVMLNNVEIGGNAFTEGYFLFGVDSSHFIPTCLECWHYSPDPDRSTKSCSRCGRVHGVQFDKFCNNLRGVFPKTLNPSDTDNSTGSSV